MAVRVTDTEVRAIIDLDVVVADTTPFIAAANRIVEDNLLDKDIEESTLKEIERWLSAHYCAVQDKRFTKEKTRTNEVAYEGKTEYFFKFTGYGQMALMLDPSGTLMDLQDGEKPKATLMTFSRSDW